MGGLGKQRGSVKVKGMQECLHAAILAQRAGGWGRQGDSGDLGTGCSHSV